MMHAHYKHGMGGRVGALMFAVPLVLVLLAPLLLPGDPRAPSGAPFLPPSWTHPLGTDDLGRDMLAALAHGGRASMWSGGLVAVGAALLGVLAGVTAGHAGGWLDRVIVRLPVVGRIEAYVIWITEDRAGFQFERIIRLDSFMAMIRELQPNPALRRRR